MRIALHQVNTMTGIYAFLDMLLSIDREMLVMILSYPVLVKVFEL